VKEIKVKEIIWLEERDVLTIHERLLALDGGASGLRDKTLLSSALARPRQQLAYALDADIIGMSAAYAAGIIGNHPFVDGNKRTGFVAGILFLELNGYRFTASEEDSARAVLSLAGRAMNEEEFVTFLRANTVQET
jgi:death-on-curing protein